MWTVVTQAGERVLELHTREKSVEIDPEAAVANDRLSILILFALYRVRQAEEAAAAASAAAS